MWTYNSIHQQEIKNISLGKCLHKRQYSEAIDLKGNMGPKAKSAFPSKWNEILTSALLKGKWEGSDMINLQEIFISVILGDGSREKPLVTVLSLISSLYWLQEIFAMFFLKPAAQNLCVYLCVSSFWSKNSTQVSRFMSPYPFMLYWWWCLSDWVSSLSFPDIFLHQIEYEVHHI